MNAKQGEDTVTAIAVMTGDEAAVFPDSGIE